MSMGKCVSRVNRNNSLLQVKVVVTLTGDKITQADINLKLPRPSGHKDFYQNTSIREDAPWGLQQIQDCSNHLR